MAPAARLLGRCDESSSLTLSLESQIAQSQWSLRLNAPINQSGVELEELRSNSDGPLIGYDTSHSNQSRAI